MDTIASLGLFPVLTVQPADLPPFNPAIPIQNWQAPMPAGMTSIPTGNVSYVCLNAATGALAVNTIPAAQYYSANVQPGNLPSGVTTVGTNPPPINVTAYNNLGTEGEEIVETPFGLTMEQIEPAPATPSVASATGLSATDPVVVALAGGINVLLAELGKPAITL